jgi:hypothetical protein
MALKSISSFNYGIEINTYNRSIDYNLGGAEIRATLNLGYYSLTTIAQEIVRAMTEADNTVKYFVVINRSINSGKENRISIGVTGSPFFSLLFSSGARAASSAASVLGYISTDKIGLTVYTGQFSCGKIFQSEMAGYNWVSPDMYRTIQGSRSISVNGIKEAIVFQIMKFFSVEFKYERDLTNWITFLEWAIQQRPLEFTPEISSPSIFYNCTLEKTGQDGNGLGYQLKEMLPSFPDNFQTGNLTFRIIVDGGEFII